MKNKIIIKKSKIQYNDNLARLCTEIYENGEKKIVFAEVEDRYAEYLCPEIADGILYLSIPIAIRFGYEIISEIPVSELFLHNINEIFIPSLVRGDKDLKVVTIDTPTTKQVFNGKAVGTGSSGGVDSFYTILKYHKTNYTSLKLTHLLIAAESNDLWSRKINDSDTLHTWIENHKNQFERYEKIAASFELPLIKIFSNYFNFLCMQNDKARFNHLYVCHYISFAHILALKKLWSIFHYSSTDTYNDFTLENNSKIGSHFYELLCNHVLSIPGFTAYTSGVDVTRNDKINFIADNKIAQEFLHPCFTFSNKNCSLPTCNKCLRCLITLDYYDKLEKMNDVFYIEKYKINKIDYFVSLLRNIDDPHFHGLYDLIKDKFKYEIAIANDIIKGNISSAGIEYLLQKLRDFELVQRRFIKYNNGLVFINDIEQYLDLLINNREKFLVIISIKDTIGNRNNASINLKLKKLGCKLEIINKFRRSYIVIIDGGKLIYENIGKTNETIHINKKIKDNILDITSSPYGDKNIACIYINNKNYAINKRGLNFVIIDCLSNNVIDSVAFDTYGESIKAYRE